MTMTRSHFQMIADSIATVRAANPGANSSATLEALAHEFAAKLSSTNPRFDSRRFLTACGIEVR